MTTNQYQYKLEKYKQKYREMQARKQTELRQGQIGGNCKYFINHECGHLNSGRCGKIAKSQTGQAKTERPCVCNDLTGVCVGKNGKRGVTIRLQQLEEKLDSIK